ncbi:MAG: glycosyltransferase [Dysgonomonas sp.]
MNNNPIQSLWVGPQLSAMEILCINSYLTNGHEFHLYAYNNILNVPKGTIMKDANEIIPKKDIYIDNFGGYVNLSNQFRFTMLYKLGGWWVDMDTVCLRPFDFDEDFVFSSEVIGFRKRINNTYMKSRLGARFLKNCLDFLSARGVV